MTTREVSGVQRAYAQLVIKELDASAGIIEGVASTPEPDRMGDVVEPKGAEFKLPMPFLWQHDSWQPIGQVIKATVTKEGIRVRIKVALELADKVSFIRDAWELIKGGLVRGLSIGFRSIEHAFIEGTHGIHFQKWEWMELSAVTVAANSEASITSIKSAYQATLPAASGKTQGSPVRIDYTPPRAGGSIASVQKGPANMKYREMIAAAEATRETKKARMAELMKAATDKGETLDAAGKEQFDTLQKEVKELDDHIRRLEELDKLNVQKAVEVNQAAAIDPNAASQARAGALALSGVRVDANVPKGMAFARYVKAMAFAKFDEAKALRYALSQKHWENTPQVVQYLKSAVEGGTTHGSAWADDLVYAQNLAGEFIEYLRPMTILGKMGALRRVPFNIRVASATSGTSVGWVGQGAPAKVSKMQTDNVSLSIAKAAGIVVLTKELVRLSSPSAEAIVRDDLASALVEFLDVRAVDPEYAEVANVSPASLTYGVTPVSPTGATAAHLRADMKTLMANFISANIDVSSGVWITSNTLALALSLMRNDLGQKEFPELSMNGGTLEGFPVIASQSAYKSSGSPDFGNMLIFAVQREIFMADEGGLEIEASDEASLQQDDAPTNSAATGTGTSVVSMFQTSSVAIKATRFINWKKRRSQAVQFIRTAAYSG